MTNEAVSVSVPHDVYLELAYQLRKSGDLREPDAVVALAIKTWMGKRTRNTNGGYQWKQLFLPDSTELRIHERDCSPAALCL